MAPGKTDDELESRRLEKVQAAAGALRVPRLLPPHLLPRRTGQAGRLCRAVRRGVPRARRRGGGLGRLHRLSWIRLERRRCQLRRAAQRDQRQLGGAVAQRRLLPLQRRGGPLLDRLRPGQHPMPAWGTEAAAHSTSSRFPTSSTTWRRSRSTSRRRWRRSTRRWTSGSLNQADAGVAQAIADQEQLLADIEAAPDQAPVVLEASTRAPSWWRAEARASMPMATASPIPPRPNWSRSWRTRGRR